MKCLLLFPPQWVPFDPHLALPCIKSALDGSGHEVIVRDLNIEFYHAVFSHGFIMESLKNAFDDYNRNIRDLLNHAHPSDTNPQAEPSHDFQKRISRYKEIAHVAHEGAYLAILSELEASLAILKDKEHFYDPALLDKALLIIAKVCKILSALYHPCNVNFLEVNAKAFYDLQTLIEHCRDINGNIFHHFYISIMPELLEYKADYIGISIGDYTQLMPGLTLSMMLKKSAGAHINIGGNLFGRYTDVLINNPAFFDIFADSIIYNEGERPVTELVACLEAGITATDVTNLIYAEHNEVKINEPGAPIKINDLIAPDFSGLPLDLYYTPEIIFHIQASRDCYWRKCSFCTHYFGSRYAVKSPLKMVDEIRKLTISCNATYFHFIDEAMSPRYLERLSRAIIEAGLDINFYIYGRFEKEFTPDLLRLARKAGLRMVLWGFETANERVYRLMNKGELCRKEDRLRILLGAYEADIWNYLFIMFGFPSETMDEAKETVHFLHDNRHILSHSTGSVFALLANAPILKDPEKYSISKVQKIRSGFSYAHTFTTSAGMNSKQLDELRVYKNGVWQLSRMKYTGSWYREKLFLYVCKYGVQKISEMKDSIWL